MVSLATNLRTFTLPQLSEYKHELNALDGERSAEMEPRSLVFP
jgi:hypothetical protein